MAKELPSKNGDIEDKVNVLLESHDVLLQRLEALAHDMKAFQHTVGGSFDMLNEVVTEFRSETKSTLKSIYDYLGHIDEEVQHIRADLNAMKKRVDEKAAQEDIVRLEARLASVEKELDNYRSHFS